MQCFKKAVNQDETVEMLKTDCNNETKTNEVAFMKAHNNVAFLHSNVKK